MEKQLMIGGQALVALGSSRTTIDTDYLINDKTSKLAFSHDKAKNVDYCNANGLKFFAAIWKMEKNNIGPLASPQALLELKAFSFVQHCQNGHFTKADDAEYDIKFLVRKFGLTEIKIANKFISEGELFEVNKVIQSVRKA
ncbi:hypothetical protein [Spirosoma sp.]|uniref:hypothetical protein n=1 Tax=Spirosoma sp. TaxID=1899569 RepID=UPI00261F234E|nr:hypothetical protein [Spirosoma sp.]MCX6217673.1 hypothetical protein [Spirosoma sp.]